MDRVLLRTVWSVVSQDVINSVRQTPFMSNHETEVDIAEIVNTILSLNYNKAPRQDNIPAEFLKYSKAGFFF